MTRAHLRAIGLCVSILSAAGVFLVADASPPRLAYVVILSRHGVRAPTWTAENLNAYSGEPWPDWGVGPGMLTPRGRALMRLMGEYYHEWLTRDHLLDPDGCTDAARVQIWADRDQRTVESARALADVLKPGCSLAVHAQPGDAPDPLFDPLGAGLVSLDADRAAEEVRGRMTSKLFDDKAEAFGALGRILLGNGQASKHVQDGTAVKVAATEKGVELTGPLATASTLTENLLLEYTNGFQGRDLGWGRLDRETLVNVLQLHTTYADLVRRTKYLARIRGSNLVAHILLSMQQAAIGRSVPGALGGPDTRLLVLSGHDTNLSNISGMLGLSWQLPGYQPDDTPPGGALVLSLWHADGTNSDVVRVQYVAQSLDQMRDATRLTLASPPEQQDLMLPGCPRETLADGCPLPTVDHALREAIDPNATSVRELIAGIR